jgi:hypothetical protein
LSIGNLPGWNLDLWHRFSWRSIPALSNKLLFASCRDVLRKLCTFWAGVLWEGDGAGGGRRLLLPPPSSGYRVCARFWESATWWGLFQFWSLVLLFSRFRDYSRDGWTDVVSPNQILLLETEYLQEVDSSFAEGVRFFFLLRGFHSPSLTQLEGCCGSGKAIWLARSGRWRFLLGQDITACFLQNPGMLQTVRKTIDAEWRLPRMRSSSAAALWNYRIYWTHTLGCRLGWGQDAEWSKIGLETL